MGIIKDLKMHSRFLGEIFWNLHSTSKTLLQLTFFKFHLYFRCSCKKTVQILVLSQGVSEIQLWWPRYYRKKVQNNLPWVNPLKKLWFLGSGLKVIYHWKEQLFIFLESLLILLAFVSGCVTVENKKYIVSDSIWKHLSH